MYNREYPVDIVQDEAVGVNPVTLVTRPSTVICRQLTVTVHFYSCWYLPRNNHHLHSKLNSKKYHNIDNLHPNEIHLHGNHNWMAL